MKTSASLTHSRFDYYTLHFAAFFSGFITMALEMLIGRTFIPYFGGTIYTWGALISVFLTGMTMGFFFGGKLADRTPNSRLLAAFFLLAALLVMAVPLFSESALNAILDSIDDARYGALVASLLFACLPAALLAAVSPFCVRLLLDSKDHSGTISGRLSGLSTLGSILGTLGTSFFFIPTLGSKMIYGALASISACMGLLFLFLRTTKKAKMGHLHTNTLLIAVTLFAGTTFFASQANAQPSHLLMYKDGLLEKVESEYNTIFIEKSGSQIAMAFGYRSNRYVESIIDILNPGDLPVTYTRYMTGALVYHSGPVRNVALVGLGGGRTINYLVSGVPNMVADVAELDPSVIDLAQRYFAIAPTKQLRIHNKDGRFFLKQTKNKFDLILLDAYRGPFVPFHLTTQEFYKLVKSRLYPGGVVAQNVEPTTLFFDSTYKTMKSVFDNVDALEAKGNIVLIAYSGAKLNSDELQRRAIQLQETLKLKYDLRDLIKVRKNDVQISADAKILTDDFAPVEMLKTIKHHNEKRPQ